MFLETIFVVISQHPLVSVGPLNGVEVFSICVKKTIGLVKLGWDPAVHISALCIWRNKHIYTKGSSEDWARI